MAEQKHTTRWTPYGTNQAAGAEASREAERWQRLKQEIIDAAPSLGIDQVGFTTADPFTELKARLQHSIDQGYASGFEEPDLDKRTQPALLLDGARSIIAIAVAYPSKLEGGPKSEPGAYRGMFARTAWGLDYHQVLRDRLQRLEQFLRERVPEVRVKSMVDTGELCDRAVAERSGIGFSGKNCSIISPKWGSWIYLGEMITNLPLPPDHPLTEDCGECTRCLDACPTGAFAGPGQLNAQRCISFQTQSKEMLSHEMMVKIGNRLYGCDTCQIVCPKNRGLNWTHHAEMQPDPEQAKPLLVPLLSLSNREFKSQFGSSAAAWRGKKPIQRNAIAALGNFRDRQAVPALEGLLRTDERPDIRAAAAWALGQIGGPDAKRILEAALSREEEPKVKEAVMQARERAEAQQEPLYVQEMESPLGPLTLAATATGLFAIEFGDALSAAEGLQRRAARSYGRVALQRHPERLQEAKRQLEEYFAGTRREFDLTLDIQGTPFQRRVWQALTGIPYGETRSYKQIAEAIGNPGAVRAVGGANNRNPLSIIVPCHRVIGADGKLVGYGGGMDKKITLLRLEGNPCGQ
ncbi:MAG: tRNA epoxyqueuosine(34) reductase QueG [Paenibacillus dendritiformis]|uniref:tRNA epoxyqueuosine(34) reductase QueG n=2 Tax=Paenibacillus TaxID=44249 RepID=UPI0025CD3630|nr:tRNA epoxyqueuosine(34) reductase QueG [uncultured Paenibacillus sp.]MDU5141021.1 tRNA epoxyqueuosine(34) reductase QueG [Paenibacillus dendritiformis]